MASAGSVRLTDQALVAVRLARASAGRERAAHSGDVLLGLASEPDGLAGRLLGAQPNAAAALVDRAATATHDQSHRPLPSADELIAHAGAGAEPRPPATGDLLAAILERGGPVCATLLTDCGYDPSELYRRATDGGDPTERLLPSTETVGLPAESEPDATLEVAAAVAVARTRASAGGALTLVLAIAEADEPTASAMLPCDRDGLLADWHALERGNGANGSALSDEMPWDRGLEAVLAAARAWRGPAPASAADLLSAAVAAGGTGPAAVLEAARATAEPPEPQPSPEPSTPE
jgi:hypothetical protein